MSLKFNNINVVGMSPMPQLNRPIERWQVPIQIIKITQKLVDGEIIESQEVINFQGTVQPLTINDLQLKPENERSWEWLWIHCVAGQPNLQTAEKIKFNNKRYKIKALKDYSLNSYMDYHLCRDYEEVN